jgi:hypothetical protein
VPEFGRSFQECFTVLGDFQKCVAAFPTVDASQRSFQVALPFLNQGGSQTSGGGSGFPTTPIGLAGHLGGIVLQRLLPQIPIPRVPPLGAETGLQSGTLRVDAGRVANCGCANKGKCSDSMVEGPGGKPVPGVPAEFLTMIVGQDGVQRCDDPCYPRFQRIQDGRDICRPPRKKPRMNPLNPRAATRAARRLTALNKMTKRIQKSIRKACR